MESMESMETLHGLSIESMHFGWSLHGVLMESMGPCGVSRDSMDSMRTP